MPTRHSYGPHPDQWIDVYLPSVPRRPGVAVIIHGGFWRSRYDAALGVPLAADLAARGHVAVNLEYRRVGAGGGYPETLLDVAAGIDLLSTVDGLDLAGVVTIGHSAGGQLAVWAAGRPQLPADAPGARPLVTVTGAVSQAGVVALLRAADERVGDGAMQDLMGAGADEHRQEWVIADPLARVPLPVPVRLLHARDDEDVPFSQSETYLALASVTGGDVALIEVTGGHMALVDTTAPAWAATVAAFEELIE
ncbi:alpha/beta hydrolase family protein [Nakamurella deserti]|uniref:alpha/beta hydrolase family protein n=1 Tax=Nakamurella deserti TaxID=2164074 RepID=UPI000DBE0439|nr:alpha/beta hydrolase [Nakamurella deserti]